MRRRPAVSAPHRLACGERVATRQRGAALLIALLMLALMLSLGTTAMNAALVDQRVASSLRDRAVAMESAEAASLAAAARLLGLTASGAGQPDDRAGYYRAGLIRTAGGGGSLTVVDNAPARFWSTFELDANNTMSTSLSSTLGTLPPGRYLIERLEVDDEGEPASATTYPLTFSRVTVLGEGENRASVLLQAVYVGLPE